MERERDARDGRAFRIHMTDRAREFKPVAEEVLAELDGLVEQALTRRQSNALQGALKGVIHL